MAAASRYVLTLDIGSSAVRACTAPGDRPWELSAGAERRQRVFRARGGGLEEWFNPAQLRAAIFRRLKGPRAQPRRSLRARFPAISVSAQRGGLALLRADGRSGPHRAEPGRARRLRRRGHRRTSWRGGVRPHGLTCRPCSRRLPSSAGGGRNARPRRSAWRQSPTLGAWAVAELTGALAETPARAGRSRSARREHAGPSRRPAAPDRRFPGPAAAPDRRGRADRGAQRDGSQGYRDSRQERRCTWRGPTPSWRRWGRVAHNRARRARPRDGAPRSSASPWRRRSTVLAARGLDSTRPRAVGWRRRTQGTRAVRSTRSAASWADAWSSARFDVLAASAPETHRAGDGIVGTASTGPCPTPECRWAVCCRPRPSHSTGWTPPRLRAPPSKTLPSLSGNASRW